MKVKKRKTRKIIDLILCVGLAPALSCYIGSLLPLHYSLPIAAVIGLIAYLYYTDRRDEERFNYNSYK